MPRPARALFVAFDAGYAASVVIASELRARGFAELVPGVMWRPLRADVRTRMRKALSAIRSRTRTDAFVMVRFVGEHPRFFAEWAMQRRQKRNGSER